MTGTPNQPPWRVLAALLLTLASFCYCIHLWKQQAPLLEAEYLTDYLRLSLPEMPLWTKYTIVKHGAALALPTDTGTLVREKATVNRPVFAAWLQGQIYKGHSVWRVLWWPLAVSLLVLLPSFGWAVVRSNRSSQEAREGRLLRGPRLVSQWHFNWRMLLRQKNAAFISKVNKEDVCRE